MKLQLALDDITLENAVELVKSVEAHIDIIEVGTPMVIEYGMEAVRTMKKNFPGKEVLADLKMTHLLPLLPFSQLVPASNSLAF